MFALEVGQDLLNHHRVFDAGGDLDAAAAGLAALDVDVEYALEALSPGFLDQLPAAVPAAFEFRHESWNEASVLEALDRRNRPWVITEDEKREYADRTLDKWAAAIRSRELARAFVFFKHEDQATGPRLAAHFRTWFDAG